MPEKLAKICGKIPYKHSTCISNVEYTWFVCSAISVKLAVRDVTQIKPRYLYKASKIQSAWDSRINLEFHENEISKLLF